MVNGYCLLQYSYYHHTSLQTGKKHWYYVSPHDLHYTSAYIANGVTFVSNHIDEDEIVKRITIWEGIVEEVWVVYVCMTCV
ncbi:hypothetical protein EON63_14555 [archaeon]|nr:MAG: hypothetical protein EON63_14555 [archaeon]